MGLRKKYGNSKTTIVMLFIVILIFGFVLGYFSRDFFTTPHHFIEGENILQNSGFEDGGNEPYYWNQAIVPDDDLMLQWDGEIKYNGSRSVSINNSHTYEETVCNNWAQSINNVPKDRVVELTGWVKTVDAESVVMVIQCWDFFGKMVAFGTTQSTLEINGTTDWQQYNASVYVPNDADSITIRLVLTGTGKVWFDDVRLIVK